MIVLARSIVIDSDTGTDPDPSKQVFVLVPVLASSNGIDSDTDTDPSKQVFVLVPVLASSIDIDSDSDTDTDPSKQVCIITSSK